MISHTYAKEEDIKKENCFSRFRNYFIHKMSLISYFSGEKVIVGQLFAVFCLLVTYLQFLGTVLFNVKFNGVIGDLSSSLVKIFNESNFILSTHQFYNIVVIILFIFNILYLVCFIIIFLKIKTKNNSNYIIFLISYYQNYNVISFWMLYCFEIELSIIMLINFILVSFYKIVMFVNIIMACIISIIYCFFGNKLEFNFEIGDYFSRLDTKSEFYLLMAKTFFSSNFIIQYILTSNVYPVNLYLLINLGISIFMSWYITSYSFYYYNIVNFLLLYLNLVIIFSSIVVICMYNIAAISEQDFIIIIGFAFFYPIAKYSLKYYWKSLLSKIPFVEIKKDHTICKYMSMLIYLVCEENLNESSKLMLIGLVKQHELNCVFEKCICKREDDYMLYIPKNESSYLKTNENFGYQNSKIYFLHLIKNIFEFLIIVTRNNNINLIMMFAYFMFYYLGNFNYTLYVLLHLKKKQKFKCTTNSQS